LWRSDADRGLGRLPGLKSVYVNVSINYYYYHAWNNDPSKEEIARNVAESAATQKLLADVKAAV
jgi:hypothetical protein